MEKFIKISFLFLALTCILGLLDKGVAVGFLTVTFLSLAMFLVLKKIGIKEKEAFTIFLVVLLIHLLAVLFIYFTGFRPAGGGADFEGYHQNAAQVAYRFSHGIFSLDGLYTNHYFPVLIGVLYIFTMPTMIVGQMFVAFMAEVSALMVYFIVREIGGSQKAGFVIGLMLCLYPSFMYFGNLLLKDTIVIPLLLGGLLLSIKMLKRFSAINFILFFLCLTGATHLRFYVGFALLFSFIVCWFVLSNFNLKKRIICGIFIIIILGFSPQLLGYGYYGTAPLKVYLNKDVIREYREIVYSPNSNRQEINNPDIEKNSYLSEDRASSGSSFIIEAGFDNPLKFLRNYALSFVYSVFGPFPWQLKYKRHILFLFETIPWYFLIYFILSGIIKFMKLSGWKEFVKKYKFVLPIILFAIMAFGALSLYINNFGIIVRIRMPMLISLFCILSLSCNLDKTYDKIFNYGRGWIHRLQSR